MIINIFLIFTEILFILPSNSQSLFLQSVRYAVQTHVTQKKKEKIKQVQKNEIKTAW
jgi:hypothetical protein